MERCKLRKKGIKREMRIGINSHHHIRNPDVNFEGIRDLTNVFFLIKSYFRNNCVGLQS